MIDAQVDSLLAILAFAAVGLLASVAAVLFWRLPHGEGVLEAMASVLLVPAKRRRWVILLSFGSSLFVLSGLVDQLEEFGVGGELLDRVLARALFVAALLTFVSLTWIGLRPAPLTESERIEASASVPRVMSSLALVPFSEDTGPGSDRSR